MLLFSQVYYIWEKMCTYVLLYHGFYLLDHLYFFPESNQNQVPFLFKWWIWGLRQTARLNWIANRFHFTRLEDRARCYDELNTTYYIYIFIFLQITRRWAVRFHLWEGASLRGGGLKLHQTNPSGCQTHALEKCGTPGPQTRKHHAQNRRQPLVKGA